LSIYGRFDKGNKSGVARVKQIPGANFYKEQIGQSTYWRVRLGKKFTGDKAIVRRFAGYSKALEWVEGLAEEKEKHGSEVFALTHDQLTEARATFDRLAEYNVSLTAVVDHWIKFQAPLEVQKTFSELEEEFITSRKNIGCKQSTLTQYRSYMKVICEEFGATKAAVVVQPDLEDWLSESDWAPRTRKNYLVTLMTFFEWARDRGYIVRNPVERIPKPILDDRPPGVLAPAQAARLLKTAAEHDWELLPMVAIQLFAGLRRSEVCALEWSEVDVSEKHLEVKGIKSKTRQRRLVTIQKPLVEFLRNRHVDSGHLWSLSIDHYGERLSRIAEKAEIRPWPHNALRHSFGSYFYALTKNENAVAAEMGSSPQMVFRHYRALVKPADCAAFWAIRPGQGAQRVSGECRVAISSLGGPPTG
jgi:integrase